MFRFSTELRVGLLTLFILAAVAWGIAHTDDKPGESGEPYFIYADFPTAEGVFATTPVRIAGVIVGHVEELELRGGTAHLTLAILDHVELPMDSIASLRAEGMLGDKAIRLVPGSSPNLLHEGDTIKVGDLPPDMEGVVRKVDAISADIKAITSDVRGITGDEKLHQDLLATAENVRALSDQLRVVASANSDDIAAIAQNLRDVSEALKGLVAATGGSVNEEMAALKAATEKLDSTLAHVESIAAGIDRGEGTVGRLLKDESTIDGVNDAIGSVNDTLDQVNGLVGNVSRIDTEVFYRGDYYFGSAPTDDLLAENPVAGGSRQGVGIRLLPAEDHWYLFELAGHPQGSISSESHEFPDFGTSYEEVVVKPGYRFSFQFARRWHDAVLRFGVKDNGGGVGLDYYLFRDRVMLGADLFDFAYGSYPVLDGTPNLQLNARWLPWRHLYFEAGFDSVLMGAKYGYVTGYAGGGFYFDDQDVKFIMAALPIKP
jgi:phospholipid/cholesterol/gamma-HCH transport system substrate-binding protein